jgi:hypothetical protein
MKLLRFFILVAVAGCLALAGALAADNSGRIYARITTVEGDRFEGLLRWDKNEGSWVDILNGSKDLEREDERERRYGDRRDSRRETKYKLFGITISGDDDNIYWSTTAQSGIRFGHIKSMQIIDDDRVRLLLKSGREVEMFNGSTDIGTSIREIIIEDVREGEVEFSWEDIDRIDLMEAKTNEPSRFGKRLYGTVTTRRGDDYTGYLCWDVDELFTRDVIDGEERGRNRKIPFEKIDVIERYSSKGAIIRFGDGEEVVLRGTNDVNDDNRGIIVCDPAFGQVVIPWDEFDHVKFTDAPRQVPYSAFDGGRPLSGTVYTEDGQQYTGTILWDDDEAYTWELLDGEFRGLEFDLEFGLIKEIVKKSYRAAIVTVSDGREFELRGSNDVDEDNKGIFVYQTDGDEIAIDWEDFERVEFSR